MNYISHVKQLQSHNLDHFQISLQFEMNEVLCVTSTW